MPDRDKVIKGLECCADFDECAGCPYDYDGEMGENGCLRLKLIPDAIAMLKEQEPVSVYEAKISKCTCGNIVNRYYHPKFCGCCGKELMWY